MTIKANPGADESIRDRLLRTTKRRYATREIPGFGSIRLQSLTEKDFADVDKAEKDGNDRAMLIAKTLVDDYDDRVFADEDVALIRTFDLAVINAIASAAMEHIRTISPGDVAKN